MPSTHWEDILRAADFDQLEALGRAWYERVRALGYTELLDAMVQSIRGINSDLVADSWPAQPNGEA